MFCGFTMRLVSGNRGADVRRRGWARFVRLDSMRLDLTVIVTKTLMGVPSGGGGTPG